MCGLLTTQQKTPIVSLSSCVILQDRKMTVYHSLPSHFAFSCFKRYLHLVANSRKSKNK